MMSSERSDHKRQWRDYQTESGTRPIKDFLLALPNEDRATILEEMEHVREHGKSVARRLHKDISKASRSEGLKETMHGTGFS